MENDNREPLSEADISNDLGFNSRFENIYEGGYALILFDKTLYTDAESYDEYYNQMDEEISDMNLSDTVSADLRLYVLDGEYVNRRMEFHFNNEIDMIINEDSEQTEYTFEGKRAT